MILRLYSSTIASKAKRLLRRYGVRANIVKTRTNNLSSGCGYGLEIEGGDYFYVLSILQRNGIEFSIEY